MMRSMMRPIFLGWVSVVLLFWPHSARSGEGSGQGELQEMGERFGRFMGSFMKEMGQSAGRKDLVAPDGLNRKDGLHGAPGVANDRGAEGLDDARVRGDGTGRVFSGNDVNSGGRGLRREGFIPRYDPWGADRWGGGYGVWNDSRAHAEWDWEMGRNYYGSGAVAPWEHDRRWLGGPDGYGWPDAGWDLGREWMYGEGRSGPERFSDRGAGPWRGPDAGSGMDAGRREWSRPWQRGW
ncbi:MAG: hypothetical protein HQL76_17170 [Magnetococcales bacterium]|nr:hypothetical protein [Magnetococcales bacterium]